MSLVASQEQLAVVIRAIMSLNADEVLAIDTETSGLRLYQDSELRGVSLAWRDQSAYVSVSHPESWNVPPSMHRAFRDALQLTWALPILHNSKFDLTSLSRGLGLEPWERYADTMVQAWLIDENAPKGLKKQGARLFGVDAAEEQLALKVVMRGETQADAYRRLRDELREAGVKEPAQATKLRAKAEARPSRTWADLTAAEIAPYAEQDARLTKRLHETQFRDPEYRRIEPAIDPHLRLIRTVYRMEKRGIAVDRRRVIACRFANQARMVQIEHSFADLNLQSTGQLATLIYSTWGLPVHERTETGAPSTSRSALESLEGSHEGLDLILEYRRLSKQVNGYWAGLLSALDSQDRIHPSFSTCGTVTGRFSCSAPPLQTIPRDDTLPEVRAVFVPGPGYELWSYDLSKAELCVAASLSKEAGMIEALSKGRDLYADTAVELGISRQLAKTITLATQYGAGPKRLAQTLVKGTGRIPGPDDVKRARDLLDRYWDLYPRLRATMDQLSRYVEATGRLPLLHPGRYRRFSGPSLLYPVPPYTALNSACQGAVAGVMADVMVGFEGPLTRLGGHMVLQVHDSLVCELAPGTAATAHRLVQQVVDGCNPIDVPLRFEAKEGV